MLPEWVLEGAILIVGDRIKFGFTKGMGPTGNERSQYRKIKEHYWRWWTVNTLREQGIKPSSLYFEASLRLKGKFGKGSDETIRKSFYKVQKDLKDKKKRWQFYRGMHEIQELTDTSMPDIFTKPSTKKNQPGAKTKKPGTKSASGKK